MLHHELQTARQTEFLSRAARRRVVREASQAAKAAKAARTAADSRERYLRVA